MELAEAVEDFFQVSNKLILGLGFEDDIINISVNIAMQLVGKTQLYRPLVGGSCILQPKRQGLVGVCPVRGDEYRLDLIFFFERDLVVARVTVKEG